jgi:hypothetical protein
MESLRDAARVRIRGTEAAMDQVAILDLTSPWIWIVVGVVVLLVVALLLKIVIAAK